MIHKSYCMNLWPTTGSIWTLLQIWDHLPSLSWKVWIQLEVFLLLATYLLTQECVSVCKDVVIDSKGGQAGICRSVRCDDSNSSDRYTVTGTVLCCSWMLGALSIKPSHLPVWITDTFKENTQKIVATDNSCMTNLGLLDEHTSPSLQHSCNLSVSRLFRLTASPKSCCSKWTRFCYTFYFDIFEFCGSHYGTIYFLMPSSHVFSNWAIQGRLRVNCG